MGPGTIWFIRVRIYGYLELDLDFVVCMLQNLESKNYYIIFLF